MEVILKLLENPAVITGLAGLVALVIVWYGKKKPWIAKWMPLVISVYNMVEKEFPKKPGVKKLQAFMTYFIAEYKKRTGKILSASATDEIKDAVAVVAFKGDSKKVE